MNNPFSVSKKSTDLLFVSGQLPIERGKEQIVSHQIYDQALICLENIESVISCFGLTKEQILKTTVYLTDISQLNEVNRAYADFFEQVDELPVRSAFQVVALAKGASVEIDAVAQLSEVTHV